MSQPLRHFYLSFSDRPLRLDKSFSEEGGVVDMNYQALKK